MGRRKKTTKRAGAKTILRLPDSEQAKKAALDSLAAVSLEEDIRTRCAIPLSICTHQRVSTVRNGREGPRYSHAVPGGGSHTGDPWRIRRSTARYWCIDVDLTPGRVEYGCWPRSGDARGVLLYLGRNRFRLLPREKSRLPRSNRSFAVRVEQNNQNSHKGSIFKYFLTVTSFFLIPQIMKRTALPFGTCSVALGPSWCRPRCGWSICHALGFCPETRFLGSLRRTPSTWTINAVTGN
jgi:hypothetical protein